jgi:hypothetical protein
MPHGIEYIVRPFAAPGSLGNVVIPGTPARTQEQARITWGAVGTMPSTKLLNPSTVVNTKKEDLTELDRDSSVQRIVGNDGESYVDVARAETVRLNKEETGQTDLDYNYYRAGKTLDPALEPFLENFSSLAGKEGKSNVTWHMKNE